jgi:hypothetical protein
MVYLSFGSIRMAAIALLVAMPACDRASKTMAPPPQERTKSTPARMTTPEFAAGGTASTVSGEWRMRRGRLADHYRLSESAGVVTGEVDAAGIGQQLAVTGTLKDGIMILNWHGSGRSGISEDGRAEYDFTFEGALTSDGWSGRGVMIRRPLASGRRVPVEDSFETIVSKFEITIEKP